MRLLPTEIRINFLQKNITLRGVLERYDLSSAIEYNSPILEAIVGALSDGDSLWDVGASIGFYSIFLALFTKGKEINFVAFEPEKRCCQLLEEYIRINHLEKRVCFYPVALGSQSQLLEMAVDKKVASSTHGLLKSPANPHIKKGQVVPVERGDEVRMKYGLRVPGVIKIDVEGYEFEVLKGLERTLQDPLCHTVICEVHFNILDSIGSGNIAQAIVSYLKNHGFLFKRWLDPSHLYVTKRKAGLVYV